MVRQALPSLTRSPKPEARGPDPGAPLARPYPDFPKTPQGRALSSTAKNSAANSLKRTSGGT